MEEVIVLLEKISEQLAIRSKLVLSVDEAAKLLSLSRPTVMDLTYSEGFPAFKVGRRTMISAKGLAEWVEKRSAEKM